MIDPNTEVCVCNNLTAAKIAECVKEKGLYSLEEMLERASCPVADKCEACRDEGYNNDGINIPLVISLVRQGRL